ncbi:MAG TPA: PRC-barrel domain-containing protein [Gaiellaceae bacterium]
MNHGDPVSWFMIEAAWKVVDAQDKEIGRVEEVVGDTGADIFNGLSISTGLLKGPRYVPAELVGSITEGKIQLNLGQDELGSLQEYRRPPASEQILPPDRRS